MDYLEPSDLEEACRLAAGGEDAVVLAGGTAVVLLMRQHLLHAGRLISLQRVVGLDQIAETSEGIAIGALCTHAQIAGSPLIQQTYPVMSRAFLSVASPRIRNQATIGGNIALGDPHFDPPVMLLALGASLEIRSPGGSRMVGLHEFFHDYYETDLSEGDIISRVHVPLRAPSSGSSFVKYMTRSQDDYPAVDVAVHLELDEAFERVLSARIALGSVGPTPFRSEPAEELLVDRGMSDDAIQVVAEAAASSTDPPSDVRASAEYRRDLVRVVVQRAIRSAAEDARGRAL